MVSWSGLNSQTFIVIAVHNGFYPCVVGCHAGCRCRFGTLFKLCEIGGLFQNLEHGWWISSKESAVYFEGFSFIGK
jgi:hypothetical protein